MLYLDTLIVHNCFQPTAFMLFDLYETPRLLIRLWVFSMLDHFHGSVELAVCQLIAVPDLEWKHVLCTPIAIRMWRGRDGIQWCKAAVLHVFIITDNSDVLSHTAFWWKNVFLPAGKYRFFKPMLINRSVWRGCFCWSESRSSVVLRKAGSCSWDMCPITFGLQAMGQLSPVSHHGQERESEWGVPDAESMSFCGGQWLTVWKLREISRRGRLYPSFFCEWAVVFLWNLSSNDLPLLGTKVVFYNSSKLFVTQKLSSYPYST